jgi:lysozyme
MALKKTVSSIATSVQRACITIRWGSTYIDGAPVDVQTICTPKQAEGLLRTEIGRAEKAIEKLITAELTDNMFSALCSWTYNLGTGALQRSSL